jgi:hypothetical protein
MGVGRVDRHCVSGGPSDAALAFASSNMSNISNGIFAPFREGALRGHFMN